MHIADRGLALTLGIGLLITPSRIARAQASPDTARRVVLVGVTLFDGTGQQLRPNQSVVIQGERIAAIFPTGSQPLPAGATIYHLTGRYLIPGLIDTHVHIATDPSGEDSRVRTERRLRLALLGGVTAVRDMAGDVRALGSLQRDALLGEIPSPDIYYCRALRRTALLCRPPDPRRQPGAGSRAGAVDAGDHRHDGYPPGGGGSARDRGHCDQAVRRSSAASWRDGSPTEAHAQGLKVWAHAALRPAPPIDVVEAGVDAVSHANLVTLAMDSARRATALHAPANAPLDIDDAGLDTLFSAMVRRHTIFEPTLLVFADRAPVLRLAGAIAKEAHRRGVTIIAGTDTLGGADAGSHTLPNLHRELELLVTLAGLSPAEALESATRDAAVVLGAQSLRGTIEVGKLADLVVLRSDPLRDIRNTRSIQLVMKRGRVWRQPDR